MKTPPKPSDLNRSRLVVEQVIADVMKTVPIKHADTTTQIIDRCNAITKQTFQRFTAMHNINVVPMDKHTATEHIRKLYADEYRTWNQSDLVELLSITLAVLAAESLHDSLS